MRILVPGSSHISLCRCATSVPTTTEEGDERTERRGTPSVCRSFVRSVVRFGRSSVGGVRTNGRTDGRTSTSIDWLIDWLIDWINFSTELDAFVRSFVLSIDRSFVRAWVSRRYGDNSSPDDEVGTRNAGDDATTGAAGR